MIYNQLKRIESKIGTENMKYFKDFSNFGLWYFVSAFIAMLSTVIVNSSLVPEELGHYSYNKSVLDLFSTILSFTIYKSYLRFNTKGVSTVLKKLVYKITLVGGILLAGVAIVLTKNIIAIPFALLMAYDERFYFTRSVMDVKSVNKIRMIPVTITFLLIAIMFLLKIEIKGDYILLAYGVGYAYTILFYGKKYPTVDDKGSLKISTILKFSLPGFAIFVVNWLINLYGQVVIKEMYGYADVAKISIAQRSVLVIHLFSSLMLTFYPMVYYRIIEKKDKRSLLLLRSSMSFVIIVVGLFSFFFAELIYRILGASQYMDYVLYFRILVISSVIHTIASFYGNYLGYALKTYISLIICAIGAAVNVIMLHLLMPTYGLGVVAIAILSANIIMALLMFATAYRMEQKYMRS